MCFILCMVCVRSLYNSLRNSSLFSCGMMVVAWNFNFVSSSVSCSWKSVSIFFRWVPHSFFIRNNVCVIGNLVQS